MGEQRVLMWIDHLSVDHLHIAMGALILLQTSLIAILFIQSRRHLRSRADARKYYAEITHAARLALVGEITASIAHEVTQPLSAILSNVETAELLLRRSEPSVAPVLQILADVRHDDLRACDIVRRLRTLLRKRELQFERVDINALVSNVLALVLPDAVRRQIVIRTTLDQSLPRIAADPVHLQQVLLNLIINAMDALREMHGTERWLEIRTAMRTDRNVQVTVLDNGPGISTAHRDKLFDSFFTTKEDGMGLGLAIARSIVSMHGGAIWAENREPAGTAFIFTIPSSAH